jgi:hypothetical protein
MSVQSYVHKSKVPDVNSRVVSFTFCCSINFVSCLYETTSHTNNRSLNQRTGLSNIYLADIPKIVFGKGSGCKKDLVE